ncbi:MAG: ComF family protein [Desulforegulaceae bacterium]|nr:ComF family protein [Desulforegulaceae bacterium]
MKNLIYPDICFICKNFFEYKGLKEEKFKFPGDFNEVFCDVLCPECLSKVFFVQGRIKDLFADKKFLSSINSPFIYQDSIVDIVHLLKYNYKTFFAEKISWFILKTYLEFYKNQVHDLAVFVPMHKKAFRKRGFNQTYLIAIETQNLAKKYRVDFPEINKNVLIKIKNTRSQAGLKKEERRKNISNVFKVKNSFLVKGKKVLIIDDVCTTGSTLEECAKTLVKSGAQCVDAITFARAV